MRLIDADAALDRYYAEFEKQDICDGSQDKDWLMRCIEEAPTLTTPNEWVSVEERLPEPGRCVLVYTSYNTIESDAIYRDGKWMMHDAVCWTPLPKPPKEEMKDASN